MPLNLHTIFVWGSFTVILDEMPIIDELNKSDSSSGSSTSESSSPEYKFYFGLVEEDRDYTENLPKLEEISNTVGDLDTLDKKKKRTRKIKP